MATKVTTVELSEVRKARDLIRAANEEVVLLTALMKRLNEERNQLIEERNQLVAMLRGIASYPQHGTWEQTVRFRHARADILGYLSRLDASESA